MRAFDAAHPDLRGRVHRFRRNEVVRAKLAYGIFAANTFQNLEFLERNAIPFVFTLYPGGRFLLDDPASDARLRRIFESPLFRRVIVTQTATADYLRARHFCAPEAIEMIYGVVGQVPDPSGDPPHRRYGFGKDAIDLCFVAHKYMPGGYDKGFDRFMKVASLLAERSPLWKFHVVGNYTAEDFPMAGLGERIHFYGAQDPEWFEAFYRDKDAILLCNRPFVLLDGAFDGFPTGCGSDAMTREVALVCTDPLNLNCRFEDGSDLMIVDGRPADIADTMSALLAAPDRLKAIGENGARRARQVYSFESQLAPRIALLRSELARAGQPTTPPTCK